LNWFSGGSAQPLITHGWIKPIKAKIPDYKTQNKIGSILFGYDEVIENNLKRIKLLEEFAQITFNDWFIKVKGLSKGWEEKNLGSLVGYEIGGGWGEEIQNREFNDAAYVIRGTDIDTLPLGKLENVPFRYHKKSNLASRKLQDGDIVFEVSGGSSFEGVAKTLFITDELLKQFNGDVMCASFCKLLRPAEREYSNFTFLFLRFLRAVRATEVFEIRSASNIVNYNWTAFLKFQKVKVPNKKTLNEFNEIIDPIYKQIYNLGHQNRLLKEARDILLPRLMTGMIEV
jgi:type I restriction enzyme S subunit